MPGLKKNTIAAVAALLLSGAAVAGPITANTGWIGDELTGVNQPTVGSAYTFSLLAGQTASFKVTDQFILGDSFWLYDATNTLLATSSAFAGAANAIVGDSLGEEGWLSTAYEKLDYTFSGAGDYSFTVIGDGVGGIPAGLYVRLDVAGDASEVPEPGSLALIGLGLAGLAAARRRKQD